MIEHFILLILFIFALVVISFIITADKLILSVIGGSVLSLIMLMYYLLSNAPDVALTEAAVSGCAGGVITYYTIVQLPAKTQFTISWGILVSCIILFLLLMSVMSDLPNYGSAKGAIHQYLAPYYIESTGKEIGIASVVAAILASYRGFDTLGETIVIFIGAISVTLIFFNKEKKGRAGKVLSRTQSKLLL